jgi:hypothetical protein
VPVPQQDRYESLFLAPPQSMAPEADHPEFEPRQAADRPRARSGRSSGHRARR